MKPIKLLVGIMLAIFCGLASSCSGDDDPAHSNDRWYVEEPGFFNERHFSAMNAAIENEEKFNEEEYYEVYNFFCDGDTDFHFTTNQWQAGRFRDLYTYGDTHLTIIHIIDDTTIECYSTTLYLNSGETNRFGDIRLWHFNAGSEFGEMAYYGDLSIYVYMKENNTMVLSNGDIYVDKGDVLQDSYGNTYTRFTPNF